MATSSITKEIKVTKKHKRNIEKIANAKVTSIILTKDLKINGI